MLENQEQAGMGELGGRAQIRVAEKSSRVEMMGRRRSRSRPILVSGGFGEGVTNVQEVCGTSSTGRRERRAGADVDSGHDDDALQRQWWAVKWPWQGEKDD